jgi:hypothetical protein
MFEFQFVPVNPNSRKPGKNWTQTWLCQVGNCSDECRQTVIVKLNIMDIMLLEAVHREPNIFPEKIYLWSNIIPSTT